jgi:hypothetical protein
MNVVAAELYERPPIWPCITSCSHHPAWHLARTAFVSAPSMHLALSPHSHSIRLRRRGRSQAEHLHPVVRVVQEAKERRLTAR